MSYKKYFRISPYVFLAVIISFYFVGTMAVNAQGELIGVDLTIEGVFNIVNGLACWLTRAATAAMVIFIILAGLRFMNARGNATAYEGAKKNFNHVLIGLLVIIGVYVIIATVANVVDATNFSFIPLVC